MCSHKLTLHIKNALMSCEWAESPLRPHSWLWIHVNPAYPSVKESWEFLENGAWMQSSQSGLLTASLFTVHAVLSRPTSCRCFTLKVFMIYLWNSHPKCERFPKRLALTMIVYSWLTLWHLAVVRKTARPLYLSVCLYVRLSACISVLLIYGLSSLSVGKSCPLCH